MRFTGFLFAFMLTGLQTISEIRSLIVYAMLSIRFMIHDESIHYITNKETVLELRREEEKSIIIVYLP